MSEFVLVKAVRILVNDNIISQLGFKNNDDFDDFDKLLKEKCPEFSSCTKYPYFEYVTGCKEDYTYENYIDLILSYEYKMNGKYNWGKASSLSKSEYELFSKPFKKLGLNSLSINDFVKVEYYYENCCEPDACFDIDKDDWVAEFGSILKRNTLSITNMKRLTTDDPKGCLAGTLNFAYAKDNKVHLAYADEKYDADLCEYVSKLAKKKGFNFSPKDIMEEGLFDYFEEDFAVLYYLGVQAAELRERLKIYEDKLENGTLIELPYKIGNSIVKSDNGEVIITSKIKNEV